MVKSNTLTSILLVVLFVPSSNTATAENDCVVNVPEATAPLLPGSEIGNMDLSDETSFLMGT